MDGKHVKIKGSLTFPIVIVGKRYVIETHIVKQFPYQLLIGLCFLQSIGALVDLERGLIRIVAQEVAIMMNPDTIKVHSQAYTVIPPLTEVQLPVTTNSQLSVILLEPVMGDTFQLCPTLSSFNGVKGTARIANAATRPL